MRSALTPAFTSSKMKTIFVLVNDCCQQLVNFLEHCHQEPLEQSYEIQKGQIKITYFIVKECIKLWLLFD